MPSTDLSEDDERWAKFLASEKCPPILGLAPLSEEESEFVSSWIRTYLPLVSRRFGQSPLVTLMDLLRYKPAITTVWLARKAGEAYDAGTFWELFEGKIGTTIPPNERPAFAERFRDACRLVMSSYVAPTNLGAFKHVETFLFQAGLPLCHCQNFADRLRDVERRYGLPDPEADDAGEELRDTLLLSASFRVASPMLKRAVQGPAGPFICQAALQVLRDAPGTEINPRLRQALEHAFANVRPSQLRRSARPPYLRLSEDLGSLEIVGPKQENALISSSGMTWVVNGMRYPTPHWDEFIYSAGGGSRTTIELKGLRGGQTLSRTFRFGLKDSAQPFLIFDYTTRRLQKHEAAQAVHLKCGSYWILHMVGDHLVPTNSRYEWPNGEYAVSLLELRPESEARVDGTCHCRFRPDQSAFCDIPAKSVTTDDGIQIHYGWHNAIEVWLPDQSTECQGPRWLLQLFAGDAQEWELNLGEGSHVADMTICRIDVSPFLRRLVPALHRLELRVSRAGRRADFVRRLWYWAGLESYDEGFAFRLDDAPRNLLQDKCLGFDISRQAIRHLRTNSPRHILVFDVEGPKTFQWTQTGIYLESFEKRAGQIPRFQSHRLGETFSAAITSLKYLRIWQVPAAEFQILVNQQLVQYIPAASGRKWLDLSLAHLSTLFPNGGDIVLSSSRQDALIAKFTRPLRPIDIDLGSDLQHHWLGLRFADEVPWVRPRVSEIVSGQVVETEGQVFDTSGRCIFNAISLPEIECIDADSNEKRRVTLSVPDTGWPGGLWLVELEVRRSETADWQDVRTASGARVALLCANGPDGSGDTRNQIIWAAYHTGRAGSPAPLQVIVATNPTLADAYELLADVARLVEPGFAPQVRHEFAWLENLFHELGRFTGKTIALAERENTATLLNLACVETDQADGAPTRRSLFVTVPELLALPADHYVGLSSDHPIGRALGWCCRLHTYNLVFDAFRESIQTAYETASSTPMPELIRVLQEFRNYAQLLSGPQAATEDFRHFDYEHYFRCTIGLISGPQPQHEWDDRSALSRIQVEWAFAKLVERRKACMEDHSLGAVNALLDAAPAFRNWLKAALDSHSKLMPAATWSQPWLSVSFESDDLLENCCRFASIFALSARAAAAGWLRFEDTIAWLTRRGTYRHADEAAISMLVGMAPELFGYYLMFWELMTRTYPHD